jgi:hypothetical protein
MAWNLLLGIVAPRFLLEFQFPGRRGVVGPRFLFMTRFYARFVALFLATLGVSARAQTSANTFQATITPADQSVVITGATNTVRIVIANINQFSNVVATATAGGTNNIVFVEKAPNGPFLGQLVAPFVTNATPLTVQIELVGIDLTATNGNPPPAGPVFLTNDFSLSYTVVPRPVNDMFTNAIKIPAAGGIAFGSNTYASLEPGEPLHGDDLGVAASVWWVWSPPVNESVLVDTAGSDFATVLAIYTGSSVAGLTAVASSNNGPSGQFKANVVFQAIAGTTYHIAVAGYDTNSFGLVRLRVAPGALPDTTPPQITIASPATEAVVYGSNVLVQGVAKDDGPNDTGVAAVYVAVNGGTPVLVGTSDTWVAPVTLAPGTNFVTAYAVDLAGNVSPTVAIVIVYLDPPNDLFANAIPLANLGGTVTASTIYATKEPGEPIHAGNDGGHSIWYTFLAPGGGTLALSTEGSDFDTLLAVYTGSSITNLAPVASNDDANTNVTWSYASFDAVSNTLYDIAIDGYGGAAGDAVLTYTFTPAFNPYSPQNLFTVTVTAGAGGQAQPGYGLYPSNSLVTLTATPSRDYDFSEWNGPYVSIANPFTIQVTENESWQALFVLTNYTETFESGGLSNVDWVTSGNAPWFVETNVVWAGLYSGRSGVIGDSQSSALVLATNTLAGTGSFEMKVSSELDWDWLEFFVNGVMLGRWSGEVGWTNFQFAVAAGTNTFEWKYAKDPTISEGLDAAFIDNVYLPLPLAVTPQSAAPLTALGGQPFQLSLAGQPGRIYYIQSSADLRNWTAIATNSSPSGVFTFADPQSTNNPVQFYRAISPLNQ